VTKLHKALVRGGAGSILSRPQSLADGRFAPDSGAKADIAGGPSWANERHCMKGQQATIHPIGLFSHSLDQRPIKL